VGWHEDRAEERRKNDAARAEQRRQDELAAVEVTAIKQRTAREARRDDADHADKRRRDQRKEQQKEQADARARRAKRLRDLRAWATAHMVDLMIYPLAVVSAVMAVPAMAHYGHKVYGSATGAALPIITELGMWAFAFAVQYTRLRNADRPVWALVLGVWTFAAVGASLNYLDGATGVHGEVGRGVVMGVVSVAGVVAHQLVSAAPRRSRAERDARDVARHAADKIAAVRKAVINASVSRVDGTGQVVLMFNPGDYTLTKSGALDPIAPDLPARDTPLSEVDRDLAAVVEKWRRDDSTGTSIPVSIGPSIDGSTPPSILTPIVTPPIDLDPRGDLPRSRQIEASNRPKGSTQDRPKDRGRDRGSRRAARTSTQGRSIEALRADLKAAIDDPAIDVDPTSAESIRRTLQCSPARARALRDDRG